MNFDSDTLRLTAASITVADSTAVAFFKMTPVDGDRFSLRVSSTQEINYDLTLFIWAQSANMFLKKINKSKVQELFQAGLPLTKN